MTYRFPVKDELEKLRGFVSSDLPKVFQVRSR